jgi:CRISPR type I-E-associated protein CasB/Cse2
LSDKHRRWRRRAAAALEGWRDDLLDPSRAGDLAALGRLAVPQDAMLLPCFAELCNRAFGQTAIEKRRLDALARCAFLAGRLSRFEEGASLAAAMAKRQGPSRPLVSPVRAAALFSVEDDDQACAAIASLLGQLGGRASARLDPRETVRAMSDWERERREIALAYHRASASPDTPEAP